MADLYRNLKNKTSGNKWSIRKDKRLFCHAKTVTASNVSTVVNSHHKSFQDCMNGGWRFVFAWFETTDFEFDVDQTIPAEAKPIRFNPRDRQETDFMLDGQPVTYFKKVWLTENGEAFGI